MRVTKINKLTLKLFNCVLKGEVKLPVFLVEHGVIVPADASYAVSDIHTELARKGMNGQQLNATFHKSWKKVIESSHSSLVLEQVKHYLTSKEHSWDDEGYLPDDVINVPQVRVKYVTIKACDEDDIRAKALSMLESGIALKQETISELLSLLELLDYKFTSVDNIKNKEALAIICLNTSAPLPSSPEEVLRVLVYAATESTLIIKSPYAIDSIKQSDIDIKDVLGDYPLEKLAEVYNRFKPIFLAFKSADAANTSVVNKIAKLSKKHHKPLVVNALNVATSRLITDKDRHWLDNATPFALIRAALACHTRKNGQTDFAYQVRNGKAWAKPNSGGDREVCEANYDTIMGYIAKNYDGEEQKIYIPKHISYAAPTSEKMFIEGVPMGTTFFSDEGLSVGIYWENAGGASDIDLSAINVAGKIGWDAAYKDEGLDIIYSGDRTNAPCGATEFFRLSGDGEIPPTLIQASVWDGRDDAKYKISVSFNSDADEDYMIDPDNLIASMPAQAVERSTILGLVSGVRGARSFTLMNVGAGSARTSRLTEVGLCFTRAFYQKYMNPITLETVLSGMNYKVVSECDDEAVDLSIDQINAEKVINLFNSAKKELA